MSESKAVSLATRRPFSESTVVRTVALFAKSFTQIDLSMAIKIFTVALIGSL